MSAPNLFLIYVTDVEAATSFYRGLFELEPVFVSPRYVAFPVAPGILLALWSGRADPLPDGSDPRRSGEVGLMVPPAEVDDVFARWTARGVRVVEPPHDDVFGRTFVVADPDGGLVRVSPLD